jgi:hypothetical protein
MITKWLGSAKKQTPLRASRLNAGFLVDPTRRLFRLPQNPSNVIVLSRADCC